MAIVKIRNLTKNYPGKTALNNVNLDLNKGHIIGLLGPNGSGKTTLLKILSGVIKDYSGDAFVDNMPIGKETKAMVSFLPDSSYFSPWMRPIDLIDMFEDFYADFDKNKCIKMLESLGLDKSQRVKTMSKGMVEKFQLCLVMSRNASLYILDEPIGGVDPAARDFILDTILSNYNGESTILMSTHLISDVERIFDTVIFLKEGNIILQGEIDDIREKEEKSIDQLFREVFKC